MYLRPTEEAGLNFTLIEPKCCYRERGGGATTVGPMSPWDPTVGGPAQNWLWSLKLEGRAPGRLWELFSFYLVPPRGTTRSWHNILAPKSLPPGLWPPKTKMCVGKDAAVQGSHPLPAGLGAAQDPHVCLSVCVHPSCCPVGAIRGEGAAGLGSAGPSAGTDRSWKKKT